MDQNLPDIEKLKIMISSASLPEELKNRCILMVSRLEASLKLGLNFFSIEQVSRYISWVTSLPWEIKSEDSLDLDSISVELDKTHFGLKDIKDRILEYAAVLKLTKSKGDTNFLRAPILCFVGLAGTGKTTIAQAIAQSMKRKFIRIPLGGMSSSLELRGQSQSLPNSEPGQIIKALVRVKTKNPVILLDEVDRVSDNARADIMGVLLELLDPEQNIAFIDNYIDYPFNLGQTLFIATANNTANISTAVLDRLEPIGMPSYTDSEKIEIAKGYMLKKVMKEIGLEESNLQIDEDVWQKIVRPLGFDSGIRSLERSIETICRKVARKIVENQGSAFHITNQNLNEYVAIW